MSMKEKETGGVGKSFFLSGDGSLWEGEEQEIFLQLKAIDKIIKLHPIDLKFGYLDLLNTRNLIMVSDRISTVRFS